LPRGDIFLPRSSEVRLWHYTCSEALVHCVICMSLLAQAHTSMCALNSYHCVALHLGTPCMVTCLCVTLHPGCSLRIEMQIALVASGDPRGIGEGRSGVWRSAHTCRGETSPRHACRREAAGALAMALRHRHTNDDVVRDRTIFGQLRIEHVDAVPGQLERVLAFLWARPRTAIEAMELLRKGGEATCAECVCVRW